MKTKFRQILSLCLCILLTACLALPASSAGQTDGMDDAPAATVPDVDGEDTGTPPELEPDDTFNGEEPDDTEDTAPTPEPSEGDEDDADGEPGGEATPEPVKEVTVSFVMRPGEWVITVTLTAGESLAAGDIPTGAGEELSLSGWLDGDGEPVDPLAGPIDEDTEFTAQWTKTIDSLFDTESHRAYMQGYSNGTFKPGRQVTRAEAAAIFYGLLKNQTGGEARFSDVPASQWYAAAVNKIQSLGIITGYDDGTYQPNKVITRAEFATIAASCDELLEGSCPFPDVGEGHWARKFIVSAYQRGWISGNTDGNFNPSAGITRAEAVTIVNRMMGRTPESNVKTRTGVTNFYDVFPESWFYGQVVEATTTHEYTRLAAGGEQWTDYVADTSKPKTGWMTDGGLRYYVGENGKFVRGEQTISGKTYLFDTTGAAATGFYMKSGWKRYYKDGVMQEDISGMGVVSGPYYIKVYKPANYLIIFAKGDDGKYNIPVRSMLVSCGDPTPTGTYYTPARYRWLEMVGGSWAQWCTQILGSYLFHSVPNDQKNNYTMWAGEYNNLGTTRSLGCIRLNCEDAKWIYDNCALGTEVYISPTETSGPMAKPAGLKLPSWHTWDPTDPTAYWMCQQRGCH